MANLPSGWGDRHNRMSEHDMKLGGMAATKFGGAKSAYEHDPISTEYKNSEQVRDFYLNDFQKPGAGAGTGTSGDGNNAPNNGSSSEAIKRKSNVPDFWAERQTEKALQAKQMGVYSQNTSTAAAASSDENIMQQSNPKDDESSDSLSAEVALVQITTQALQKMSNVLGGNCCNNANIPMAERAAFAQAVKDAMDALAKQT